jgi:hypothetical protein
MISKPFIPGDDKRENKINRPGNRIVDRIKRNKGGCRNYREKSSDLQRLALPCNPVFT